MNTTLPPRTLALAGLFQAARLAQQLAREGRAEPKAYAASINSILSIDAPNTESIFGGAAGVRMGLELLRGNRSAALGPKEMELARYVISLIQLERRLSSRPAMLARLRQGIETAVRQMGFFGPDKAETGSVHPLLTEKLAAIYTDTISTLTPRIMVGGEHGHLSNPAIAAGVRAALLAGIRAAVLWHQLGGRRWQLLLTRSRIADQAQAALDEIR